jgi:hypothetical protein
MNVFLLLAGVHVMKKKIHQSAAFAAVSNFGAFGRTPNKISIIQAFLQFTVRRPLKQIGG